MRETGSNFAPFGTKALHQKFIAALELLLNAFNFRNSKSVKDNENVNLKSK